MRETVSVAWFNAACVAGFALAVAACQAGVPEPAALEAPVVEELPEEPLEVPPPEFLPEGGARENQEFIDYVVTSALDTARDNRTGQVALDALLAAGIDISVLEVTRDFSLIELPVDSVTLAVRFDNQCVIAQWGNDWYVSQVEPALVTGACLVGETVSLD